MNSRFYLKYLHMAFPLLLLSAGLVFSFSGCGSQKALQITQFRYERGHGSAGGNRFYIQVCPDRIQQVHYMAQGAVLQETDTPIPITQEQWQTLCAAVQELDLKQMRQSWWKKLLNSRKLDGGAVRTITLILQDGKENLYKLPDDEQTDALEQLLMKLAVQPE